MKKVLVLLGWVMLLMVGCGYMLLAWDAKAVAEKSQGAAVYQKPELFSETGYYYRQLSAKEKVLYADILQALKELAVDVPVAADTEETLFNKVFQCVLNDHPEIFYVDGFTLISYTENDVITGQTFSGSYLYDAEEIKDRTERIEEKILEILKEIPSGYSQYEKVKFVYEYLVTGTEYVLESEDNQNICSVFLNGKSVCQGYAKAAQYLLERLGLTAVLVSGVVEDEQEHAWNIVQIDGNYYHVDVTWGDASYVRSGDIEKRGRWTPQINYEYLCVPDEQLLQTHGINSEVKVPACNSLKANYYVMEGTYFTETDIERVSELFEKAYERQETYVTLKCADIATYREMKKCLIEEQAVFRFWQKTEGTIAYTVNEQQLSLSFWLQD